MKYPRRWTIGAVSFCIGLLFLLLAARTQSGALEVVGILGFLCSLVPVILLVHYTMNREIKAQDHADPTTEPAAPSDATAEQAQASSR